MTTDPTNTSPYTTGIGVPARLVFCSELNWNDTLGSSSAAKSGNSGRGKSRSTTLPKTKAPPPTSNALVVNVAAAKP